ncbi:MAG: cation:proton antiporter [Thermoplasmata archaeon]|nr:cation:proton antiporter [Thermoplasmata archaeon]
MAMEPLYEIAILLMFAFIGSILSSKLGQSTLVGYIIIGMLIGPNISINIFGHHYTGFVQSDEIIHIFSELGVMLLLFFVGLDFSVTRLKQAKNASVVLSLADIGTMLFAGFVIGAIFAWPFKDTFFLACIMGMSSVAVTAKALEKLQLSSLQTRDTLIGMMLIEDFLSIILVIVASSFMNKTGSNEMLLVIIGLIIIFIFFLILYVYVVPLIGKHVHHLKDEEIMGLFALAMVFFGGVIGIPFGISPIIGAFFVGLSFSETKLKKDFEKHLTSFKHIFVAIFFLAFGMMISPSGFLTNLELIFFAMVAIIVCEMFILSAVAYLVGLPSRDAVFVGNGALPRSEEAVIFANIGTGLKNPDGTNALVHSQSIYPFTGAICLITTLITPVFLKIPQTLAHAYTRVLPGYMRYSGAVIARTIKKIVFPRSVPIYRIDRKVVILLFLFLCVFIAQLLTTGLLHYLLVIFLTPAILIYLTLKLNRMLLPVIRHLNYSNLGMKRKMDNLIETTVSGVVVLSFLMLYFVSATWQYSWLLSIILIFSAFIVINFAMYILYKETTKVVVPKKYVIVAKH